MVSASFSSRLILTHPKATDTIPTTDWKINQVKLLHAGDSKTILESKQHYMKTFFFFFYTHKLKRCLFSIVHVSPMTWPGPWEVTGHRSQVTGHRSQVTCVNLSLTKGVMGLILTHERLDVAINLE